MMNIEVEYRYRDWGNFKRYGAVVFANRQKLTMDEIRERLFLKIPMEERFIARDLKLPNLFFKDFPFDPEYDHGFHELCSVSETAQEADDPENRDILDFLLMAEANTLR